MSECEQIVKQTRAYGDPNKVKCHNKSTFQDDNGRLLCGKHFKKWFKKVYKTDYDKFINTPIP